jgi:hypothetical protein
VNVQQEAGRASPRWHCGAVGELDVAHSTISPDAAVFAVEFKVNFISPAKGERLIARGRVLKPGRTLTVCQGEVFAVTDGREKLVATMLATMIAKEGTGLVGLGVVRQLREGRELYHLAGLVMIRPCRSTSSSGN